MTAAAAYKKAKAERPPPVKEPTRGQLLRESLQQAKDELEALKEALVERGEGRV